MGDATSGDGGNDDPHRAWRRPAPGEPEPTAGSHPSLLAAAGAATDQERSIWGPEAQRAGPATTHGQPPTPAAWTPAGERPEEITPEPGSGPRWAPGSGPPAAPDGGGWNDALEVGVDERLPPAARAASGQPAARWWARGGITAAVLAAILIVVAVASGSDSGGGASMATSTPVTSAAPPTTARRALTTSTTPPPTTSAVGDGGAPDAVDLAPEHDPRVMLTDLPDGFAAVGARLLLDHHQGGLISGLLFVGDGATWVDGPWVRVSDGLDASFVGPVTPVDVAGHPGRAGRGAYGTELVVVDHDGGMVAVEAEGLPPGAAAATAAAVAWGADGSWSVSPAALPPGLQLLSGDVSESLTVRPIAAAMVNYQGPGGVGVAVYSSLVQPGYDPREVAAFYVDDLSFVTIGTEQGVMGTYRAAGSSALTSVQWRHGGIDIEMTSFGMEPMELLALAAHAATRADQSWTERQWTAAERTRGEGVEPVVVEQTLQFGEEGEGTLVARRAGAALWWWVDGTTGFGIGRSGREASPVLLQVAANNVSAIDRGGVTHVVALALGDASIEGATVRLRVGTLVTDVQGSMSESGAHVHPIAGAPDEATTGPQGGVGYALGAAVTMPWTEGGFVAELVAADGVTVLATATPADL